MTSRPIRVLELRSVWGTGGGPEKTILLGTARTDPRRFAITVCYLRDARDDVFGIDRTAATMAVDYTEIVERHSLDLGILRQLRRLVRDRRIDIVHAHEYKSDVLALILARTEGVLPVATVHGWTGHSTRERWLYYPLDKRVLTRFPALIAVSEDVRRELVAHGADPHRVVTVLNGIDHLMFRRDAAQVAAVRERLGIPPDDFVVGAVGRLEPQKRFDLLIEAFAAFRRTHSRARLVLAGAGSLDGALRQQAVALDVADRCTFLGHYDRVVELHHAFDLLVQSSDYEGTPNAVLEAMALETPIVATAAGGTAEIARPGQEALIVPCGRANDLAAAIAAAACDPAGMRTRAAAARRRVETDLSFDARMRAVETVYVDLFQQRDTGEVTPEVAVRV